MEIYTDGSCRGQKKGACGILVVKEDKTEHYQVVTTTETTNNIMEMCAVLLAIYYIKDNKIKGKVKIYSDSEYTIKGLTEWYPKWKKNGYKTAAGKPVANLDLWNELVGESLGVNFELIHVKGHNGNEYNEKIDKAVFKHSESQKDRDWIVKPEKIKGRN
jgi:ribonuclease HI